MEGNKPTRRRGTFAAPVRKSDKDSVILQEMRKMLAEGIYLTDGGLPDLEALSDRTGFRVSKTDRDRLMKKV